MDIVSSIIILIAGPCMLLLALDYLLDTGVIAKYFQFKQDEETKASEK